MQNNVHQNNAHSDWGTLIGLLAAGGVATSWILAYWLGGWLWLTWVVESTIAGACGYCWYLGYPDLKAAWVAHYRRWRQHWEYQQIWKTKRTSNNIERRK